MVHFVLYYISAHRIVYLAKFEILPNICVWLLWQALVSFPNIADFISWKHKFQIYNFQEWFEFTFCFLCILLLAPLLSDADFPENPMKVENFRLSSRKMEIFHFKSWKSVYSSTYINFKDRVDFNNLNLCLQSILWSPYFMRSIISYWWTRHKI